MKYILFDLDGTLTDPMEGITKSVEYALNKYNIKVNNRKELISFIGPPLIDSFIEFYGFTKEEAIRAVKYYREYFSEKGIFENFLYDGVTDLLESIREKGYKIVLATSKPYEYAVKILKHFDLYRLFDFVSGATMDEKRSRKESVIEYALNRINFNNTDSAVMVGDRCYDIIGGKSFGLETVGVLYGYGSKEELIDSQPDFLAKTVNDLKLYLLGI